MTHTFFIEIILVQTYKFIVFYFSEQQQYQPSKPKIQASNQQVQGVFVTKLWLYSAIA